MRKIAYFNKDEQHAQFDWNISGFLDDHSYPRQF